MLRKIAAVLGVSILLAVPVLAQGPPDPGPAIEALKQMAFLEGNWAGEGWIQMGPGGREEFTQVEIVEYKLDGAVMVIEGIGHSKADGSKKVHHALGVMSFDPTDNTVVFSAFVGGRPRLDVVPELTENGFVWSFSPYGNAQVRYTIVVDGDSWDEIGEYSSDGETWLKFFEMHVTRQSQESLESN